MRILAWLAAWQIKNTVLHALRSPRKLVPLALMAAYLVWVWVMIAHKPDAHQHGLETLGQLRAHRDLVHTGVFLALTLLVCGALDRGFAGGSLRWVPADVDYLFPAPFPRRTVLLCKLAPALLPSVVFAAVLAVYSLAHPGRPALPGWVVAGAVGLCWGGYANLGVAIELVFGLGKWPWGRRAINALLLLTIAYVGLTCWLQGLAGLARISQSGILPLLFYPCRLASDAASAPLGGSGGLAAAWLLVVFYGLTLALLFSRNENYYEPALTGAERVWQTFQAHRENPWLLIRRRGDGSPDLGDRAGRGRGERRPYTVRAFGRGAGALFWAHLAAAGKTPFVSLVLPALAGAALAAFSWRAPSDTFSVGVGLFTFYYLASTTVVSGVFFFQRALRRQELIRPLPLPARAAVLAEVGPRTLLAAPFYVVAAAGVLLAHGNDAVLVAGGLLGAPLASLCLNLLQYTLALWYPGAEDKAGGMAAQTVQLVGVLLLMPVLAALLAVPVAMGAPVWLTLLVFWGGSAWWAGFLLALASGAYAGYQPGGGPITIDRPLVRRYLRPAFLVAALALGGGTVTSRINAFRHRPPPPPPTVTTRRGDLTATVSETGTLEAADKVDVRSKVAGRLLTLTVREGQPVRAGQVVATVDRTLLDPQIARARAQLAQAQARLAQTQAAYRLQMTQSGMAVRQAQAGLASARAHLASVAAPARPQEVSEQEQAVEKARIAVADAERSLRRKQDLAARGFASQAGVDSTQTAADTARSSLAAAGQALSLTRAGPRAQDVASARAAVDAASVQLASARANALQDEVSRADVTQAAADARRAQEALAQLEVGAADTRIVVPASGRVLKTYRQVGEIVQSATTGFSDAQSLVATLGSRLEVRVAIGEGEIARVRPGASATVHVDAVPGASLSGHVTEIAPASTAAFPDTSGAGGGQDVGSKFAVKVALDRDDARLRPGMSAAVDILCGRRRNVVLAPLSAIHFAGDTGTVTVLTVLGERRARAVRLGLRGAHEAEVVRGLHAGQALVVPGRTGPSP